MPNANDGKQATDESLNHKKKPENKPFQYLHEYFELIKPSSLLNKA